LRPLTVLTGIVLGSAAAASFSLSATLVVFLFLREDNPQFRSEMPMLTLYTAASVILTGVAAISFMGEVRERPWRRWSQAGMWGLLVALVLAYVRWRLER
jgi:hypothetical protein